MVAAHNNTLEGVGILLSGLFVATSKGLDADLLAELCVLIYLCRIRFIFACEPSLPCLPSCPEDRSGSLADRRASDRRPAIPQTTPTSTCCAQPCGSPTFSRRSS